MYNVKPFFGVQRQLLIYLHAAQNGELLKTLVIPLKTTEGDYTVLSVLYRKLVWLCGVITDFALT